MSSTFQRHCGNKACFNVTDVSTSLKRQRHWSVVGEYVCFIVTRALFSKINMIFFSFRASCQIVRGKHLSLIHQIQLTHELEISIPIRSCHVPNWYAKQQVFLTLVWYMYAATVDVKQTTHLITVVFHLRLCSTSLLLLGFFPSCLPFFLANKSRTTSVILC